MFGWLRKKISEPSGEAPPKQAAPSISPPPAPSAAVPEVLLPSSPNASVETPVMPVAPPPLPTAPPASDDWSQLLQAPPEPPPVVKSESGGSSGSGRIAPPSPPPGASRSGGNAPPPGSGSPSEGTDVLIPGCQLRAIPEKQPATPRGWNVTVTKVDQEGIWVVRTPAETDPLPVSPKEILTLVMFDERRQLSFDCPVIKVKSGNPEQVLVGRPLKSLQEKSKLDSIGGRQHYRIETQLPVEIKIAGAAGKGLPPLSGHTRDISKGGLAVVVSRGFERGRELELRVLSWNFPLQLKARVVRCDELPNQKFLVAIAFPEDMSAITRDLVTHFIMENQRGR